MVSLILSTISTIFGGTTPQFVKTEAERSFYNDIGNSTSMQLYSRWKFAPGAL